MLNNPKKTAAASGTHSTKRNGQRKKQRNQNKRHQKKKSHNRQKSAEQLKTTQTCNSHRFTLSYTCLQKQHCSEQGLIHTHTRLHAYTHTHTHADTHTRWYTHAHTHTRFSVKYERRVGSWTKRLHRLCVRTCEFHKEYLCYQRLEKERSLQESPWTSIRTVKHIAQYQTADFRTATQVRE